MKLKRLALALIAGAMSVACSIANACSISATEESPLEFNRVTLSGETLVKVAKRTIDAPISFNGQWQINVTGYAFPNEKNALALAEQWKDYAIRVLTDVLGIAPERLMYSGNEVYLKSSLHYARGSPVEYPAIEISIAPICPPGGCHLCSTEPPPNPQAPPN
jgi:hypothetical protein